jgi:hypothetical protein
VFTRVIAIPLPFAGKYGEFHPILAHAGGRALTQRVKQQFLPIKKQIVRCRPRRGGDSYCFKVS